MQRLTDIACRRPWRVLAIAGVIFVVAVVVGGAIVNSLQASLGDFEDPSSQTAIATRMLQQATGAEDDVGMVALLKMSGAVRGSAAAVSREEHVAVLMQHQPGFLHAYDYVATEDSELVSRDGRETLVLGTFRTRETAYAAAQRNCAANTSPSAAWTSSLRSSRTARARIWSGPPCTHCRCC